MTDFIQITGDNIFYALALSFAGGVMTSLTPCVYPVIMITVAVFGATQSKSKLRAFTLSLTFAGAIIIMYTTLGIVSALTGTLFGSILSNKWFIFSVAGLFILMALSMFGLFTIQLPESLRSRFAGAGKAGYAGAFVMGLVSGLLAAPCTGPVMIGILAFVSTTKSVAVGGALLFAYSFGLTLLFIFVGTFVMALPKSGKWLDAVKDILGVIMLFLAFYFMRSALPLHKIHIEPTVTAAIGLSSYFVALAGLVLLVLGHTVIHRGLMGDGSKQVSMGRKGLYHGLRVLAIVVFFAGAASNLMARSIRPVELDWVLDDEKKALALHKTDKKPLLIDFTALWCEACQKIDKKTFSDKSVRKHLDRFVLLRMDLTDMDDDDEAIQEKYGIGGLPTLLIFDSGGKETSRITEFIGPGDMIEIIKDL
ncbi:MAG: cytochrome c biogenesis protein CcdA [Pseudomonadota bacterium]